MNVSPPERYQDDVKKRVKELIDRKVAGQEITAAPVEQGKAQIIDIMEALKASLAKRAGETAEAAPAEERKPAKGRAKTEAAAGATGKKAAKK